MSVTSGEDVARRADAPPAMPGPSDAGRATADEGVPRPADGLELIGEMAGSGARNPPSLVRRGDGQAIQLTTLLYLVLEAVDGERTYDDIAAVVSERYGRSVRPEDVRRLVDSKLRPLGLLLRADGSPPAVKKANPLLALRLRYVVADPQITRRITAPFAVLFFPLIVPVVLVAFGLVASWVLFEKGLASATHQAFDRPELLLTIFAITVVSAGFHEFGHAAAARYGGATPGAMGVGLYLIWPAFYTDVTDSYRLGRSGRLRTDLGGLYFNAITAIAAFGVWWATRWDAFLLVIPTQIIQMVQQLTPFVRFDGYHLLADLTGVPDLYHRIKPTLLGVLPNHWGDERSKELKPWAKAIVVTWVLLVVPLIASLLGLSVLAMPRLVATAWKSLRDHWTSSTGHFGDGDIVAGAADIVSIIALVLPILGVTLIVTRLVRRASAKVWRATEGHRARRVGAEASALAVVALLAAAWWPSVGDYRPVQAYERGTLTDVVSAVVGPTGPAVAEGRGGVARTIWPDPAPGGTTGDQATDSALPTRDQPVLAIVLVPRDAESDAAPTWVFPFDRPLPPAEGDNQALAVNTVDGSTLYDVAFALVWVDDSSVVNVNEAYAFASCSDCTTVAVGFQVILAVGQVDVAVPQNLAVAVNHGCVRCVTAAVATQLMITLPEALSPQAMAELAELWEEIRRFGETIEGVPLPELQARLTAFEARILDIVERDAETDAARTTATTATTETTATDEAIESSATTVTTEFPSNDTATTARSVATTVADATPDSGVDEDGEETTASTDPGATIDTPVSTDGGSIPSTATSG